MRGDKVVQLHNGNTVHSYYECVEFTRHALQRMLERVPHLSVKELAAVIHRGVLVDWKYVPEWFSVRSWRKRRNDIFIVHDNIVVVIARDKGRGSRRVVKTIITEECGE